MVSGCLSVVAFGSCHSSHHVLDLSAPRRRSPRLGARSALSLVRHEHQVDDALGEAGVDLSCAHGAPVEDRTGKQVDCSQNGCGRGSRTTGSAAYDGSGSGSGRAGRSRRPA